jgi:putative ABC transport system ATP-binding protein
VLARLLAKTVSRSAAKSAAPSDDSAPVVEMRDVRKRFVRGSEVTQVLCGIDLTVQRGDCTLLTGPSGCGKSTLLSILGCVLMPDAGEIRVMGQSLAQLDARRRALLRRDKIGFVFQRFHLLKGLTALENVCVPLTLQGHSAAKARRRGRELLEAVGLADRAESDTRRLSQGQCQRVALARALANDPQLILADEPTAALDEATGRQVMELMQRLLREFQKTAVIVTHDARIYGYADRILRMEHGQLQDTELPRPRQEDPSQVASPT